MSIAFFMLSKHAAHSHTNLSHSHWLMDCLVLTAACLFFYMLWLGHYPLFTPDEGRYSEVAREMIAHHDYITPRVNEVPFLDKPILHYWLQALAMQWFGVKEWVVRLFPALFGVFGCLMTYGFGRVLFNRKTGFIAACILATAPLYFSGAHYANLDLEVAVLISGSLLFWITGAISDHASTRKTYCLIAYFFAALAFLTKGLIGIVLPGAVGLAWIMLLRRFTLLKKIYLLPGIMLFLIVTLPWYILVQRANPEFLHYFFITQQFSRFLSSTAFNNLMPFWFYIPVVLLGFLPWTGFMLLTFMPSLRHFKDDSASYAIKLYLLLWIGLVAIFFSIPKAKLVGYILPIFPAMALWVGHAIERKWEKFKLAFFLSVIGSAIFLMLLVWYAPLLNRATTKPLVMQLKPLLQGEDEVVNYFNFYHDTALYLERRITLVANWHDPHLSDKDNWVRELWYGMSPQKTASWLIEESTFWQRFNSNKRLFVFLDSGQWDQFKTHAKHYHVLGQYHHTLLISNVDH